MSEVEKFNCMLIHGFPCMMPKENGLWVQAADYDASQVELAALREELSICNHQIASFLETTAKVCDLLGIDTEDAKNADGKPSDVLFSHAESLRQRLTAAEQRNAELEGEVDRLNRVKLSLKTLAENRADNCSVYRQHLSEALVMAEKVRDTSIGTKRKCLSDLIVYLYQHSDAALKPTESGASE